MSALHTIARALHGDVVGRDQISCPGPDHRLKDRSLSVWVLSTEPWIRVHSHAGDPWQECLDHVRERLGITEGPRRARGERYADRHVVVDRRDDDEIRRRIVASIVDRIVPLRGTPGEAFLRDARHIDVDQIADVLDQVDSISWNPSVLFREPGHPLDGKSLGCIVAVMTDPMTAKPTGGISRTYVDQGIKVAKAKGLGPTGIVRITPDEDVTNGLYLAEGLETALDMMARRLRPMWSCGSTSIMAKMPVVSGIECLTILADHDENGAGERAALELEQRWLEAGREVLVIAPAAPGDFNDITMRGAL